MAIVPRKLLIVKRLDAGYNVMIEVLGKTMSLQVSDAVGEEMVSACQSAIIDIAVQRGLVNVGDVLRQRR